MRAPSPNVAALVDVVSASFFLFCLVAAICALWIEGCALTCGPDQVWIEQIGECCDTTATDGACAAYADGGAADTGADTGDTASCADTGC